MNMLEAQVGAVRQALLRLDPHFTNDTVPIVIGETGWPTAGHASATPENAATYANNVIASGRSAYLFEAFDEQKKAQDGGAGALGDAMENNWGAFAEDGTPKYTIAGLLPHPKTHGGASPSPSKPKAHAAPSPSPEGDLEMEASGASPPSAEAPRSGSVVLHVALGATVLLALGLYLRWLYCAEVAEERQAILGREHPPAAMAYQSLPP
jgi:hypothetical protein